MIVKLSGLVSEVAGSMGGMTLQRSPDGTIARNKPLPIRRQNGYTGVARQRLKTVVDAWAALKPVEKALWDAFAATVPWYNRFGDPVTGNGYRAFLKNFAAAHYSASDTFTVTIGSAPPSTTNGLLPKDPHFRLDVMSGQLSLTSADPAVDADTNLFLFVSQPFRPGRRVGYTPKPFLLRMESGDTFPFNLTSFYIALHGTLPSSSGLQSAFLRIQAADKETYWPALDTQLALEHV